jgi:multidrug efflux system membrane fusion protein
MTEAPATGETPQGESPSPSAPAGGRRRWPWVALGAAVFVCAALLALRGRSPGHGSTAPVSGASLRPVPVAAAAVKREDVPVYLEGLGSVVAYKTVAVKPQVDGRLEQVLFREGQAVRRGDVLAQIDPRPFRIQLQQAQGALARDEAQLENARLNVQRDRELVAQKLIAPQQLDTDVATAGQFEGAVRIDRSAIATARLNLDYARIKSPIDGVTGIRQVDPGNVVHAADPNGIVVITQVDPIAVVFTLPQDELTAVATALASGPVAVDAFSGDGSTLLGSGRLELIDNQINQSTSTIRLKAILPNPRRLLWPNQFVNARLHLATRRGALVVPAQAVQRGPGGAFVYVIGPDMTASPRPVRVEATQGALAIVASGVAEGERVVAEGQNLLKPGSRVAVREPASGSGPRSGRGSGSAAGPDARAGDAPAPGRSGGGPGR